VNKFPGLTRIFCESLDRFVTVRVFEQDQVRELFNSLPTPPPARNGFIRFVVPAVMVDFRQDIEPSLVPPACTEVLADLLWQELFSLCVHVNPQFDLVTVELPGAAGTVWRHVSTLDCWLSFKPLSRAEAIALNAHTGSVPAASAIAHILQTVVPGHEPGERETAELLRIVADVNRNIEVPVVQVPTKVEDAHAVSDTDIPAGAGMERLLEVMDQLRDPDNGCPWDREQNHETLKAYLVEETHEVLEAIDSGSPEKMVEELGDLLMQVVFHARLAKEAGQYDFDRVAAGVASKLIHRHPHVFADGKASTPDEVIQNWEAIKKAEKKKESLLDGVPASLPTLLKSFRLQEKASVVAGEAGALDAARSQLESRFSAFLARSREGTAGDHQEDFGQLLFELVNIARLSKVNAEFALQSANREFVDRFQQLEKEAKANNSSLGQMTLAQMQRN
jgi:tetrapyrrole methylase family protein/MazG family protein